MSDYVADTHALYWYLINSPRLGTQASKAFDEADQGLALIYVPAIALAELYYLNKKYQGPLDFAATIQQLRQSAQFILLPFDAIDLLDFDQHTAVSEMHDRIIVGVARRLNLPASHETDQSSPAAWSPRFGNWTFNATIT